MFHTWKCRATYGGFSSRTGKNVEFDENVHKINAIPNPTAAGIIELDKYLNEPLIHRTAVVMVASKKRSIPSSV